MICNTISLTFTPAQTFSPTPLSRLGPKMTLLAVDLPLYILGWAGVVAAGPLLSLPLLLLARGLTGISVGLSVSIVPNYVIDISSPDNQGLLGLMPQLMVIHISSLPTSYISKASSTSSTNSTSLSLICSPIFNFNPKISLGLLGVYVVGALVDWWWTSLGCLLLQVPSPQEVAPPPLATSCDPSLY